MDRILVGMVLLVGCGGGVEQPVVEADKAPVEEPAVVEKKISEDLKIFAVGLDWIGDVQVDVVKNETATVTGRFAAVTGDLYVDDLDRWNELGGEVRIPLSGWDSELEIRDERIRDTFFQVASHPVAVLKLSGMKGISEPLGVGQAQPVTVTGALEMAGVATPLEFGATLTRTDEKTFGVEVVEPVSLSIKALGLNPVLAALVTQCGHSSVGDEVKVRFQGRLSVR